MNIDPGVFPRRAALSVAATLILAIATPAVAAPVTPPPAAPMTPGPAAPMTPGFAAPMTPGPAAPVTPGLAAPMTPGLAAPVLLISVDGMKPEYVFEADRRSLKIPYLRSLLTNGTYADGVTGVWPTVTYPSHTTLVTGVSPAEHGILANAEFDPEQHFKDSWFWYADQIRAPTLWQAARAAKLTTASVGWPVTVGATDIDFLIPEYWRISGPTKDLNPSDRYLIAALCRPVGLLTRMQKALGPYLMANDTSLEGDEVKTRFAIDILRSHEPAFMTVHLSSLDDAQHGHGPFSTEANQDLEAIDGLLAKLAAAAHAANPAAIVAIVSDHGFTPLTHRVNLLIPFLRAGLVTTTADPVTQAPKLASWKAQPWAAGGMAAVMLHDPADENTQRAVRELIQTLATDANDGIAKIDGPAEIARHGAFPGAAFLIVMKSGYYAAASLGGEFVSEFPAGHGGHGFSPEFPGMKAAFFIAGAGIAHGRNLGAIDMRQVAPTLAQLLGVRLSTAKQPPLNVRQ
jgi:predicted AlkP superfamily pyrophosphatase or phosphodiesterase